MLKLVKYSLLKAYNVSLVTLESGFFDVIAANNIANLTGISYASLAENGYIEHTDFDLPFYVRAYGYGFSDKELNILLAGNKCLENAKPRKNAEKILYINIRSRFEDRHCEESYFKTMQIALAELKSGSYDTIVLDGMTNIKNDKALLSKPLQHHIDSQLEVASEYRFTIENNFAGLEFVNLINLEMTDKIPFALKSSVFVGPYGSGTWPAAFMRHGIAFVLFQGDPRGLKTDPSFDYVGNNINVLYKVVQVGEHG